MTRYRGARPGAAAGTGLTHPGPWAEQALCAQADPDAWFPGKGQHAVAKTAMRICRACPVRVPCLDYALSGADTWGGIATGIWGGTTPHQRAQLRQQRKTAAA
jgi:WhiB family transcriptional regulator, redox-sensing transcriptional regulator